MEDFVLNSSSLEDITRILCESDLLYKDWTSIINSSRILPISKEIQNELKHNLNRNYKTIKETIRDTLEAWREEKGNLATFNTICEQIKNGNFLATAEKLIEFRASIKNECERLWKEHWFEHEQLLSLVYSDEHVSIYYDNDMDKSIVWIFYFVRDAWKYVKNNFGSNFGPSEKLYGIFHQGKYSGGHPGYFYSSKHDNRNVIDIGILEKDGWVNKDESSMDLILQIIAYVVESTFGGIAESPSFQVWGSCNWGKIFMYDFYLAFGYVSEAKRCYNEYMIKSDSNVYWLRNWFYPIYKNYGGSRVLKKYFEIISTHFPNDGKEYSRLDMNLGEFVHFWSGAASKNLIDLALNAFKSHENFKNFVSEFYKAQNDFPNVSY